MSKKAIVPACLIPGMRRFLPRKPDVAIQTSDNAVVIAGQVIPCSWQIRVPIPRVGPPWDSDKPKFATVQRILAEESKPRILNAIVEESSVAEREPRVLFAAPDDPSRLFPDGHRQSTNLRQVEQHALRVLQLIPKSKIERTRDVIQLTEATERGVSAVVTEEALELRLPTVEWVHPHEPLEASRSWKSLPWDKLEGAKLKKFISAARAAREDEYKKCKYCGHYFPPEHRHGKNVCHGCAEKHECVVH
jgi:hypothetical protein